MKLNETGVLPESNVYFHTASLTAQKLFFTLNCTGHYICNEQYMVKRPAYDSFLLLYVMRGKGYCCLNRQWHELDAGTLVLLDCYQPHQYGTNTGWEILWVHFDGKMARAYFNQIAESKRQIILPKNGFSAVRCLQQIYQMFHIDKYVSEALISQNITSVLTEFLICEPMQEGEAEHRARIEDVLRYINENIHQHLTLEMLAGRASLSPFYFSRVFKQETGYTLRDYLIHTRINAARYYLRTTDLPLKEITGRCGYGSTSTFCTMFKKITGRTPLEYRSGTE